MDVENEGGQGDLDVDVEGKGGHNWGPSCGRGGFGCGRLGQGV